MIIVRLGPPPPERFGRGGRHKPLDFQNLKRKSIVTHHSNRKRDKEEDEDEKKEEIYNFWSYDGQGTHTPPLPS